MTTNGQDWSRLAAMLVARRVELGYPGKRRAAFARDRGLSHTRTIDDLENGRRTNFEAATLAQVEQIYGWKAGSVAAVLAGGNPTPDPALRVAARPAAEDAAERVELLIEEIWADARIPEERKAALVRMIRQAEAERQAVADELRRWRGAS